MRPIILFVRPALVAKEFAAAPGLFAEDDYGDAGRSRGGPAVSLFLAGGECGGLLLRFGTDREVTRGPAGVDGKIDCAKLKIRPPMGAREIGGPVDSCICCTARRVELCS